jgi:uncharacterized protein
MRKQPISLMSEKRENRVQTVEQALRAAQFYTDGVDYHLLRLPRGAVMAAAGVVAEIGDPFCALLVDKDEVTLLIPAEAVPDFANRLRGSEAVPHPYRLLTLDVVLEPSLVGFMARITGALAAEGVSVIPLGAWSRDHLLVPTAQFELALSALQRLQSALQ